MRPCVSYRAGRSRRPDRAGRTRRGVRRRARRRGRGGPSLGRLPRRPPLSVRCQNVGRRGVRIVGGVDGPNSPQSDVVNVEGFATGHPTVKNKITYSCRNSTLVRTLPSQKLYPRKNSTPVSSKKALAAASFRVATPRTW